MGRRIALLLVLGGCQKLSDTLSQPAQTLKSADGTLELVVPGEWDGKEKLNDQAVLQASRPGGELYVIVLTEAKEDLADMTLDKFSQVTRTLQLQSMKDS